jgi:hypothetical protein
VEAEAEGARLIKKDARKIRTQDLFENDSRENDLCGNGMRG